MKGVSAPDRMKQKEAGLRKNGSPLLRDMAIQMEPIAIMVRLRRARMAAARFRSMRGEEAVQKEMWELVNDKHEINSEKSWHAHSASRHYADTESYISQGFDLIWVDIWEKQKNESGSILLSGSVLKKKNQSWQWAPEQVQTKRWFTTASARRHLLHAEMIISFIKIRHIQDLKGFVVVSQTGGEKDRKKWHKTFCFLPSDTVLLMLVSRAAAICNGERPQHLRRKTAGSLNRSRVN